MQTCAKLCPAAAAAAAAADAYLVITARYEGSVSKLCSFDRAAGGRLRQLASEAAISSLPEAAAERAGAHHLAQLRVLPAAAEAGVRPAE